MKAHEIVFEAGVFKSTAKSATNAAKKGLNKAQQAYQASKSQKELLKRMEPFIQAKSDKYAEAVIKSRETGRVKDPDFYKFLHKDLDPNLQGNDLKVVLDEIKKRSDSKVAAYFKTAASSSQISQSYQDIMNRPATSAFQSKMTKFWNSPRWLALGYLVNKLVGIWGIWYAWEVYNEKVDALPPDDPRRNKELAIFATAVVAQIISGNLIAKSATAMLALAAGMATGGKITLNLASAVLANATLKAAWITFLNSDKGRVWLEQFVNAVIAGSAAALEELGLNIFKDVRDFEDTELGRVLGQYQKQEKYDVPGSDQDLANSKRAVEKIKKEYRLKFGKELNITSAERTRDKQQDLYDRWQKGEKGIYIPTNPDKHKNKEWFHLWAIDVSPPLSREEEEWMNSQGWRRPEPIKDPVHYAYSQTGAQAASKTQSTGQSANPPTNAPAAPNGTIRQATSEPVANSSGLWYLNTTTGELTDKPDDNSVLIAKGPNKELISNSSLSTNWDLTAYRRSEIAKGKPDPLQQFLKPGQQLPYLAR